MGGAELVPQRIDPIGGRGHPRGIVGVEPPPHTAHERGDATRHVAVLDGGTRRRWAIVGGAVSGHLGAHVGSSAAAVEPGSAERSCSSSAAMRVAWAAITSAASTNAASTSDR